MSERTELYPVVHLRSVDQAVDQTGVVLEAGADGVFLIDMAAGGSTKRTVDSFNAVDEAFPDSYVGVNILMFSAAGMYAATQNWNIDRDIRRLPNGIWVDDVTVHGDELTIPAMRDTHPELSAVEYFGGIAFKYTRLHTEDPERAAAQAREFGSLTDVVTTSGPGTGMPSNIPKLAAMKEAIGEQPLAVASGVDPDNVVAHAAVVDKILVATGIETYRESGEFDPSKLDALISNMQTAQR